MENYSKIRLVGRGAYGTVFLCYKKNGKKLVIAKEIPVDQMSVEERQVSMNEAKVLAMLDHPNVIAYDDSFLEDKTMVIIMEYVQGGTLFDYLSQRGGKLISEEEVLNFFGQMVYTLQYVHGKQILHRDMKLQNVLLNEKKNIVKIGDFGISKVLSSKSKAFSVVGTPCYISPELCEGKPYNQKSDIWALGCILYELMTLKKPFDAVTLPALIMKIMKGSFDPVPDIYSNDLQKLLFSMLHLDPTQRPSAAQIMCQPLMIKVIFQLYVDIGSIPCSNRSKGLSQTATPSDIGILEQTSQYVCSASSKNTKQETSIWFCEGSSTAVSVLPVPSKHSIKSISLGSNYKIGITESGLLISWIIRPRIQMNLSDDVFDFNEFSPYIATIIDERVAVDIISVACGQDFVVCLSSKGVVFIFGKASSGCLGFAAERDIHQPRIVEALFHYHIDSIACGPRHVLALSEEKELFSWGHGEHGCLGQGDAIFQVLPKLVEIRDSVEPQTIFCGYDCSFIVDANFFLYACGSNRHNKLGFDSGEGLQMDELKVFTLIKSELLHGAKIVSVSAGKSHTAFITEGCQVYTMGSNRFGQLGWGVPGLDYNMPRKVEKIMGMTVEQIVCGDCFTMAVTNDKDLYCWGKGPASLSENNEVVSLDFETPSFFKMRHVQCVSCYSDNCLIVEKSQ